MEGRLHKGHYASKLNGLRMIPTFLIFCQVMDVREFFGMWLFTLRLLCFGWTVMVRMKLIIAILLRTYNISRDKIFQVLELCEVLLINNCLSISISIMLSYVFFLKKMIIQRVPQTPSFVSKFFFQTKQQITPKTHGPGWGASNGSTSSSRLFHRGSDLTWGIGGLLLAKQARLAWRKLMFFWGVWWGSWDHNEMGWIEGHT